MRWRSPSRRLSHRDQLLVVTSEADPQAGRLLYITDWESRLCFLIDTGSEVSIIPPSKAERKNQQHTFGLLVANNSPILIYGTHSLTLNLGLCRTFQWLFMIANMRNPILGADFLKHYGLVIDAAHNSWIPDCDFLFRALFHRVRRPAPRYYRKSRLMTSWQLPQIGKLSRLKEFRSGGLTAKLRQTKILRSEHLAVGKIHSPYHTAKFSQREKFTCEFFRT